MKRRILILAGLMLAAGVCAWPAWAWHARGHGLATQCALAALPEELPAFFREGIGAAESSGDPDLFTKPFAGETSHAAEAPEHYLDIERVEKLRPLPADRYEFLADVYRLGYEPKDVGLLPYAITEWTQRLTVAFAEYRRHPDDEHIRAKCLVYAGFVAHYAEDLTNPLHTTIHYNGRAREDGSSPHSGIHLKTDALLQKLRGRCKPGGLDVKPVVYEDIFRAVMKEFDRSHALVDKVYELEAKIPAKDDALPEGSPAEAFAKERLKAAAQFTADLYLTAWRDSDDLRLPDFYERPTR